MSELKDFQNDVSKREAVKAFMVETLKEMTVQKVMLGEPTAGLKEAFELVAKLFDKLDKTNK